MRASMALVAITLSALTCAAFGSGEAAAAVVKPSGVSADSELPAADGVSYSARNVSDRKVSTVWVEGDTGGSGLGSAITMDLSPGTTISELHIWNGNWYSWDFWNRHNRAKEIEVEFSDGTKQKFTLQDEQVVEQLRLTKPVTTDFVKVKIKSIHRGSTFNDTVISEIMLFDGKGSGAVTPALWRDSSHLEADADGSYEAASASDYIEDTMWCEGDAGDGTGQWIEADFGGTRTIRHLEMVNGNGYGLKFWMKSNAATEMTATFADGTSKTLPIKKTMIKQQIDLGGVTTSSIRLTFTQVAAGKEFNDLCMSEIRFYE